MKTLFAMAAMILLAGGASANAQAANAQATKAKTARPADCLRTANIYDFTPVRGNRALIVTDNARRKFKLSFGAPCTGLQYKIGLEFRGFGSGLSCMARGDKVIVHDVTSPPECLITSVVPYTAEMEKADAEAAAAAKAKKP